MTLLLASLLVFGVALTTALPIVQHPGDALYNPNLFEGDIMGVKDPSDRKAIMDEQRWPQGVIPYVIDGSLGGQRDDILRAMEVYHSQTCIRFVPRTNEQNFINIFSGAGCYSYVGLINAGGQEVSLQANGCIYHGTILHELMHAVGFWHEQSRSDRDDYLNVYLDNVEPNQRHNFDKLGAEHNRFGIPFDQESIMIYGEKSFSRNGEPTMLAKNGGHLSDPYDKSSWTQTDANYINQLYRC